ncbi:MAG TPA: endonuclease/exonuclease/phosphatase family protein [Brumimicrobium sp.]|nr:endonuclease/exonuclease/phosphatase family protein [Brumimicrobium sp.]
MILLFIKNLIRLFTFAFSFGLLLSYLSAWIPPKTFWFFQLFGLAYPVLLVGTLLFFVINFLLRKKFIIPLIVLLLGSFTHLKYFGIDFKSSENTEQINTASKLKVMSYNVRLFDVYELVGPKIEDSKAEFIAFFKENEPDILCLQEYAEDKTNPQLISPTDIKNVGGYINHVTTLTLEAKKMTLGQAIFSKYPIINSGTIGDSTASIPSLYADIVKGEDTIRIYNFHLQSIRFQKDEYSLFDNSITSDKDYSQRITGLLSKLKDAYPSRVQQAKQIIEHARLSPYATILNGDLNDPPTSYAYSMITKHFKDAFYAADFGMTRTYAGKVPAGRIDYIFHDEKLLPLEFKTHHEKILSDHYAITGVFEIFRRKLE